MPGTVNAILGRKGAEVTTIEPTKTLHDAVRVLEQHGIGALVVSEDGSHVAGILSERDIVRAVARHGAEALDSPVSGVMTHSVTTCDREATADQLLRTMTESRFRHVPVVEDGALVGIVSIGDVVKSRIEALEVKAENLEAYVTGTY